MCKLVQDDAIISQKEKFGIPDVKRVSREKMGITVKMRKDMLAGVDVELNTYRHLWEAADYTAKSMAPEENKKGKTETRGEKYNAMVTEISVQPEKAGLSMNEARSYARQAIAAYPNEQNLDVLIGYAMTLHKSTLEK